MCKTNTRSASRVELVLQQLYLRAMKAWTRMAAMVLMVLMVLGLASLQAMAGDGEEPKPAAQPPLSLRLTDEVINKAVRETLLEQGRTGVKREPGKALSGDAYQKFERGFSEAEKPGCMGPNALKFQPSGTVVKTPFGAFNVGAGGIFALPFWAAAVVRGKCN